MKSVKEILILSTMFEKKAQASQTTAADIQNILKHANLWNIPQQVSPLLRLVGAPNRTKAAISIVVSPGGDVSFQVNLSPDYPTVAHKFANILKQKFGNLMSKTLSGNDVNQVIVVPWLSVQVISQ